MRRPDSPEDLKLLSLHLEKSNALGIAGLGDVTPRKDVTVLMYFFWAEDKRPTDPMDVFRSTQKKNTENR